MIGGTPAGRVRLGRALHAVAAAVLVVGCRPGGEDRQAYTASLEGGGLEACAGIGDAGLRGECTALAAVAIAAQEPERAVAACDGISVPVWRAECHFGVVEQRGATGPAAVTACQNAGMFAAECIDHASKQAVADVQAGHDVVGDEARLAEGFRELTLTWYPDLDPNKARWNAEVLVAHVIAGRGGTGSFDRAVCGAARTETCAWAYWLALRGQPAELRYDALCAGPLTASRVRDLGAMGWRPEDDPFGPLAWTSQCAALDADGRPVHGVFPFGPRPLLRAPLPRPGGWKGVGR